MKEVITPEKKEQERQLVKRCIAGDEAASRELIGQYIPAVDRFFGKYRQALGEESADQKQEFWLHLFFNNFRALQAWDGRSSLSTWLARCVRNWVLDYTRSRKFKDERKNISLSAPLKVTDGDAAAVLENLLAGEPGLEAKMEQKEAEKILAEALEHLDKDTHDVILMREMESMKFKDIAVLLDRAPDTVLYRYHQGIEKINGLFLERLKEGDKK